MTTSTRPTTYDSDFYTWTQEQAELLRQGRFADVDLENVIEELETLGRAEYNSLVSAICRLTQHLLKWQYQPLKRLLSTRSWKTTIDNQRTAIADLLEDNPGLKSRLHEAMTLGYKRGRREAAQESRLSLSTFPETCPYTWEQLTDEDWLPD
jgi:hypothetical protein